jgi:predicted RNase H-like HicB family nuclease
MPSYIAVIHKEPDSDYGVSFPDFPGCVTAGSTIDEAKDMAIEALTLHIKGMMEDGESLPQPSSLQNIRSSPEYLEALAFMVIDVPGEKQKSVRINITMPSDILRQVDSFAKNHGLSRSSFLVQAVKKAIGESSGDNISA